MSAECAEAATHRRGPVRFRTLRRVVGFLLTYMLVARASTRPRRSRHLSRKGPA